MTNEDFDAKVEVIMSALEAAIRAQGGNCGGGVAYHVEEISSHVEAILYETMLGLKKE